MGIGIRGHGKEHRRIVGWWECRRVRGLRRSQRTGDHAIRVTKKAVVLPRARGIRNRTVKEGVGGREEAVARGHEGGTQVHGGEHGGDGVAGEGSTGGRGLHAGAGVVPSIGLVLHAHSRLSLDGDVGGEPLLGGAVVLPPGGGVGYHGVYVLQLEVWQLAV